MSNLGNAWTYMVVFTGFPLPSKGIMTGITIYAVGTGSVWFSVWHATSAQQYELRTKLELYVNTTGLVVRYDFFKAHPVLSSVHIKGAMQQGHNFIFLKFYIHVDFIYSDHVKKQLSIKDI